MNVVEDTDNLVGLMWSIEQNYFTQTWDNTKLNLNQFIVARKIKYNIMVSGAGSHAPIL